MKKYFVLVASISLLLIAACNEKANFINNNFIGVTTPVVYNSDSAAASIITTTNYNIYSPLTDSIFTGNTTTTLVGRTQVAGTTGLVTAKAYLRFDFADATQPPDSAFATAIPISAALIIDSTTSAYIHGDATGNIGLKVSLVQNVWPSGSFYSNRTDIIAGQLLGQGTLKIHDTAQTVIPLDTALVRAIINARNGYTGQTQLQDSTGGIVIEATSGNTVISIPATSTLSITLNINGGISTSLMPMYQRGYTVQTTADFSTIASSVNVQGGTGQRAYLRFNLAKIPNSVQVQNATLELSKDTTLHIVNVGEDSLIVVTDTLRSSASRIAYSATTPDSLYSFNITSMVQRWLLSPSLNRQLTLRAAGESAYIEQFRLFGANALIGKRPRLKVTYLVTPTR
jgi:hypothetical protein